MINRIDDVRPEDPDSSMKIWCIDYGDFGIALVEGIDRRKKSQVTRFVERHGDHACQHVAYDCHDLERFRAHLLRSGGHPRGAVLVRHDGFGVLKQMFAKGYAAGDPTEASFAEYVERPRGDDESLHDHVLAGRGPRRSTSRSRTPFAAGDDEPFIDFSRMPSDWRVPAPQPRHRATRPPSARELEGASRARALGSLTATELLGDVGRDVADLDRA